MKYSVDKKRYFEYNITSKFYEINISLAHSRIFCNSGEVVIQHSIPYRLIPSAPEVQGISLQNWPEAKNGRNIIVYSYEPVLR